MHLDKRGIAYLIFFFVAMYSISVFYRFGFLSFVPDEAHVVFSGLKFFRDLNFTDPHAYALPVMTISYVIPLAVTFIGMFILGLVGSVGELTELVITKTYYFVPIFRIITIAFSVASLLLVYNIATQYLKSRRWALITVYLVGTSFVFTQVAPIAVKWIPQLFFVLLALWYALRLYKYEILTTRHYIMAGVLSALSYGIAFVGLISAIPFLFVFAKKGWRQERRSHFWKHTMCFLAVVLVLITLITLSSPTLAKNNLLYATEVVSTGTGEGLNVTAPGFRHWGYLSILWNSEALLLVLSVLGGVIAYRYNRFLFWMFVTYMGVYYVMLGPIMGAVRQRRAVLFIPILALFATLALRHGFQYIKGRSLRYVALSLMLVAFLASPFLILHELHKPTSHEIARIWIWNNVPSDSVIYDECLLELDANATYRAYVKQEVPELYTTKHGHVDAQGDTGTHATPSYFVVTDPWGLYASDFTPNMEKEQYFVLCTTAPYNTEEFSKELYERLDRFAILEFFPEGKFTYVLNTSEEFGSTTLHPLFHTLQTTPYQLRLNFKDVYGGAHITILKIHIDR